MSTTRRAEKDSPFRQERFASSAEFERGLLGNLVARRVELLSSAEDRKLIWWLQSASWIQGGLSKMAEDLIADYPDRVVSLTMQKYGLKPGQNYEAKKVETLRKELTGEMFTDGFDGGIYDQFILRGEGKHESMSLLGREDSASASYPTQYPAQMFADAFQAMAKKELPQLLCEVCLDPAFNLSACCPVYFPSLISTLRERMAADTESKRAGEVVTELGKQVCESLDYSLETGCMVIIDGFARTGKTHSAKAWCELHSGQARYVQVPSSNDDIGFFRAIAKSLGVSINQNSKAQQLRDRIEDTLQRGKLALVFDEAHYCWPQSNYREATPSRINWIMTALVNQGVPVALVTTPQFMRAQSAVERKSAWTSEQFTGRIGDYKRLPDSLSETDLRAVARKLLPEGCPRSIDTLVAYAQGSAKYLAAIESAVRRARYDAQKAGRSKVVFADVRDAIKSSVIPSDTALHGALIASQNKGRARSIPKAGDDTSSASETSSYRARTKPVRAVEPSEENLSQVADSHRRNPLEIAA